MHSCSISGEEIKSYKEELKLEDLYKYQVQQIEPQFVAGYNKLMEKFSNFCHQNISGGVIWCNI